MCSHRWSEFLVVLPFMGWQCDAVEANVSHVCSNLCRWSEFCIYLLFDWMEIKAEFSSVAFSSISCSFTAFTKVLSKSWRQVVDSCSHLGRADGSKFQNFSSRSSCSCYMLSLGEKGGFLKSFWGSMSTVQADGAFCTVSPKMDTRLGSEGKSFKSTNWWLNKGQLLTLFTKSHAMWWWLLHSCWNPAFFSWEIQFCRLAASDTVPGDAELDSDLPISTDDTFVFTKGIIILSLEAQQCGMPVGPRRPGGLIPWPSALKLLLSAPWWSQAVTSGWPGCCTVRWVHIWLFSAFSALPACF